MKDRELFPNSKQMNEVLFKIYDDTKDIKVRLADLPEGWEMDKTPESQVKFIYLLDNLIDWIIN